MASIDGSFMGFLHQKLLLLNLKKNIFKIAQSFGYKPKLSHPASVLAEVTIEVPAEDDGTSVSPDLDYALMVNADSIFSSKTGRNFRLLDDI